MATIVTIDGAPQILGFANGSAEKPTQPAKRKYPVPGRSNCFCFDNDRTKRRHWGCKIQKDPTKVATGKNRTGFQIQKGLCPIPPR
jgi:hypothetical protein